VVGFASASGRISIHGRFLKQGATSNERKAEEPKHAGIPELSGIEETVGEMKIIVRGHVFYRIPINPIVPNPTILIECQSMAYRGSK
jgi:hypothetical protein